MLILIQMHTKVDIDTGNAGPGHSFWLWAALVVVIVFAAKEFIITREDGSTELSPERTAKLARELDELDEAEQYVLIAARDGQYPCYHCPGKSSIFLQRGFVWKYGVTRKGEQGRYGRWHVDNNLLYITQYTGPLQECFRQEKLKIYNYALLPENLSRTVPLIRPPGNKQDN